MPLNNSTPAQYALILIDLVERQGHDRNKLLHGTTLAKTGVMAIGARVGDSDFTQLVNNAFSLTRDPALGLKLGLRLNLSAHAVLGQTFMTCRNLTEVMDVFLNYYHVLSPALEIEFETSDERCFITTLSRPDELGLQFSCELMYGAIINTLQGLLNKPNLEMRLELPYPRPAHADLYTAIFGNDIHFNCPRQRISFNQSLMSTELPSSNPALRNLYEQECARMLADLEKNSVAEQSLQLLRKLEGQYPQMPQLAQMLNFSARTYRRKLEQEQQSYQELLDQVRAEHATRYLKNTDLPLSTIAYIVGFNDASNFRRAYTRWTGKSPRDVRQGD
ncbi:MAG: AraC-like DNA-binding protein [Halioglobus sp.]|jgi:AraC-like DNA-binding protein